MRNLITMSSYMKILTTREQCVIVIKDSDYGDKTDNK
jgi:hypothetical protein